MPDSATGEERRTDNTPEDAYQRALKVQRTLQKLLAEINELLEATKRLAKDAKDASTGSQSSPT
jgi:hypothetical protein